MKLFPFIKIIFNTKGNYEKLSKYERGKNRFMLMRFMSIKYPETANLLNINGTDPAYINDCFRLICKRFTRTPGWIYTKVRKPKKNKNSESFEPMDETISFYLKKNGATRRDYNELLKTNKKDILLKELKELEKQLIKCDYGKLSDK